MLQNDHLLLALDHVLMVSVCRRSDADSDVLADYVLALIRADTPEPELRTNAIINLDDFLKDSMSSLE